MNKPILDKSLSITRGALPGSKKLMLGGVPFREVALSGGEPPVRNVVPLPAQAPRPAAHWQAPGERALRPRGPLPVPVGVAHRSDRRGAESAT